MHIHLMLKILIGNVFGVIRGSIVLLTLSKILMHN